MNKTIYVMGTVKENKNKTLYIDAPEGRVFLGKISGFVKGQEIMGEAICSERNIDYPAVGTLDQPGYIAANQQVGWQVENYYSEEMLTKKQEFATRRAKASFETAKINKATTALGGVEITSTSDIYALIG